MSLALFATGYFLYLDVAITREFPLLALPSIPILSSALFLRSSYRRRHLRDYLQRHVRDELGTGASVGPGFQSAGRLTLTSDILFAPGSLALPSRE